MKKAIFLFLLIMVAQLLAQEKSTLTVKSTEINNGVVIVIGQKTMPTVGASLAEPAKKAVELQCNKDMSGCAILKPGTYVMVKLPPNRGMYDCVDIQVFAPGVDPDQGERTGEYCLIGK